ncbi:RNA 2',3'-cyclic phosphodiesterase [Bacillus salacetis]|uniref:RNA 2',3'-cyclic phosphodiesterase n=1 Tax=Bacillus salacetis TaxID=2315464 RepID=A0A3A1R6B7_9BACI|nr:RNA 2',3'-cyclic phosphodiesterase [Bacillus salacetis]RIW35685.1 RNA 2',3'-cyclic phosphodiesterase [Bacillus salacetis]
MKQHHYFYAVPLPVKVKAQMAEWASEIKMALPFHRWVHPQDVHITLAFLGGTEEDRLKRSIEKIQRAAEGISPFSLETGKLGVFGNPISPRVLWADVGTSSSLSALRENVYSVCQQEGYQLDQRPYNPHITIARKWKGEDRFSTSMLEAYFLSRPLVCQVEEFVLYRTHLDRTPKYEVVEKFILNALN